MKKLFSLVVFTLFGAITYLLAIPAYPHPRTITQADGTIITIVQRGDENAHYTITEDGVLITQNENGIYEYAEISNLEIRATGVKALPLNQRSAMDLAFLGTLDTDLTQLSVAAAQKPQKSRQASSGSKVKQSVGVQQSLMSTNSPLKPNELNPSA